MALAELAEKGNDADLLKQMIQYVAQRMTEIACRSVAPNPLDRSYPSEMVVACASATLSRCATEPPSRAAWLGSTAIGSWVFRVSRQAIERHCGRPGRGAKAGRASAKPRGVEG